MGASRSGRRASGEASRAAQGTREGGCDPSGARRGRLAQRSSVALASWTARAQDLGTIKVGVLEFGTVNWELDVIKHHGLDRRARLHARGPGLRQRRGDQRGAAGRGGRCDRRRLPLGLAPAQRRPDADLRALLEHRRRAHGAARFGHREPGRPQGQEARRRRRAARQELAAAPGACGQASRHGPRRRGRAGVRRAAAAEREGPGRRAGRGAQLLALRRPARGQGLSGSWSASRRRSASSASTSVPPQLGYVFYESLRRSATRSWSRRSPTPRAPPRSCSRATPSGSASGR